MNRADLEGYRKALVAKKEELLREMRRALGQADTHSVGLGRGDSIDEADVMHEAFISLERTTMDAKVLREVEDALRRIGTPEFGICENCGEPIAPKRLNANPWARLCIICKEQIPSVVVSESSLEIRRTSITPAKPTATSNKAWFSPVSSEHYIYTGRITSITIVWPEMETTHRPRLKRKKTRPKK